jgi:uncharacterized MAPEG superfamily protein
MPIVLYVLFALSFIPILMAATGVVLRIKQFGRLDNNYPRLQQAEMRGVGARVNGAQANSWEALVVFLLVVFIAHAAGLPLSALNNVAIAFLALRLLYCALYVIDWAWPRTAVFAMSMLCCMYIFYLAASHVGNGAA